MLALIVTLANAGQAGIKGAKTSAANANLLIVILVNAGAISV